MFFYYTASERTDINATSLPFVSEKPIGRLNFLNILLLINLNLLNLMDNLPHFNKQIYYNRIFLNILQHQFHFHRKHQKILLQVYLF